MLFAWHFPFSRHASFIRQLQGLSVRGFFREDPEVMFGNNTSYVFHATITNFYSVTVEDLVEFIFMWEVFVN